MLEDHVVGLTLVINDPDFLSLLDNMKLSCRLEREAIGDGALCENSRVDHRCAGLHIFLASRGTTEEGYKGKEASRGQTPRFLFCLMRSQGYKSFIYYRV